VRLLAGFGLFSWVSPPSQKIKTVGAAHTRKDARALPPAGGQVTRFFGNFGLFSVFISL